MARWLLAPTNRRFGRRIVLRFDEEPRANFLNKIDKRNRHFALMVLRRDAPDFFQGGRTFERFFDAHLT